MPFHSILRQETREQMTFQIKNYCLDWNIYFGRSCTTNKHTSRQPRDASACPVYMAAAARPPPFHIVSFVHWAREKKKKKQTVNEAEAKVMHYAEHGHIANYFLLFIIWKIMQ